MKRTLPIILTFLILTPMLFTCRSTEPREQKPRLSFDAENLEFDTYWVVVLKRGPKAGELAPDALKKMQGEHVEYILTLLENGVALGAGPFQVPETEELRGLIFFPGAMTQEEVAEAIAGDPAGHAGRLEYRTYQWRLPKGLVTWTNQEPNE